jgi:hypothetical protein
VAYLVFGIGKVILDGAYLAHRANVGKPSDLSLNEVWTTVILVGWPILALAESMDMSMKNAAVPAPWLGPINLALLIGFAASIFLWVLRRPRS